MIVMITSTASPATHRPTRNTRSEPPKADRIARLSPGSLIAGKRSRCVWTSDDREVNDGRPWPGPSEVDNLHLSVLRDRARQVQKGLTGQPGPHPPVIAAGGHGQIAVGQPDPP